MTSAEVIAGLQCGSISIGQLNWLLQESLNSAEAITSAAGVPTGAPITGDPVLYKDTTTIPERLYFWDGAAWEPLGSFGASVEVFDVFGVHQGFMYP
jgi:hypothetical protein